MSINFKKPKKTCDDRNCPFHGTLAIRGRVLEGVVHTAKMDKTVIVDREFTVLNKIPKIRKRHGHIASHSTPCIDVKEGDRVRIAECRPISKTVSFVVVEKLGEEK